MRRASRTVSTAVVPAAGSSSSGSVAMSTDEAGRLLGDVSTCLMSLGVAKGSLERVLGVRTETLLSWTPLLRPLRSCASYYSSSQSRAALVAAPSQLNPVCRVQVCEQLLAMSPSLRPKGSPGALHSFDSLPSIDPPCLLRRVCRRCWSRLICSDDSLPTILVSRVVRCLLDCPCVPLYCSFLVLLDL
jgi:hypothetical protein